MSGDAGREFSREVATSLDKQRTRGAKDHGGTARFGAVIREIGEVDLEFWGCARV